MHILRPAPGELLDRLTILELKLEFSGEVLPAAHHLSEMRAIRLRLKMPLRGFARQSVPWKADLSQTNRRIWEITDIIVGQMRLPHTQRTAELGALALEAFRLNIHRSEVVQQVNTSCGANRGWEKVIAGVRW